MSSRPRRQGRSRRLAGVVTAGAIAACSGHDGPARRNVVLVTIDTLRADHLGCYGYPRDTSPFLDRMAAAGARFTDAVSACSHTGPAHASIFTGLSPIRHRVLQNGQALPGEVDTLAELLEDAGYETIGITAVGFLSGLQAGFDDFLRGTSPVAAGVVERAIERLSERGPPDQEPPLFLWLHFFDVHTPYRSGRTAYYRALAEAPREEHERIAEHLLEAQGLELDFFENGIPQMLWLANNYDAEIRTTDEQLARFYEFMDASGWNDDTLWIFVADHGEGLGDHRYHGHDRRLYQEQLSIPLIVHVAGDEPLPPATLPDLVRHVDLLPTVLDWAGVDARPAGSGGAGGGEGTSLWPLLRGRAEALTTDLAFSQRRSTEGQPDWIQEEVWSLRAGAYKYIRHGLSPDELYDLDSDPLERRNLVEEEPDVARHLDGLVTELVAGWSSGGLAEPLLDGDGHVEELRALGYLDGE